MASSFAGDTSAIASVLPIHRLDMAPTLAECSGYLQDILDEAEVRTGEEQPDLFGDSPAVLEWQCINSSTRPTLTVTSTLYNGSQTDPVASNNTDVRQVQCGPSN